MRRLTEDEVVVSFAQSFGKALSFFVQNENLGGTVLTIAVILFLASSKAE